MLGGGVGYLQNFVHIIDVKGGGAGIYKIVVYVMHVLKMRNYYKGIVDILDVKG